MTIRIFAAAAAVALFAGPAWADCQEEIQALDAAVVAAETGAAAGEGSLPATEHQEEVLKQGEEPMETAAGKAGSDEPGAAGTVGDVEAVSPHQQQVVRELNDDEKAEAAQMIDEARELAQAGDEQACMSKVAEIRQLVGTE